MVFHTAIIEDIGANLRTPFDFLLTSFNLGLRCLALLQFAVVELRAEQTHRILAVFQLLTTLGVFDEDFFLFARFGVDILIAQTHTGLHLIDVLTTSTTRTEEVPTDFGGIYINFNRVVHQGGDENRGKGGHALALGIVGTHTHQTVHTIFALEEAISHIAFHLESHGLDASFIAILKVGDSGFVAIRLSIAEIHAHEHRSPVLRLRAASTRIDFHDARHRIFLLAKHILQLQIFDRRQRTSVSLIHFLLSHHLVFVELKSQLQFICHRLSFFVAIDPLF